MCDDATSQLDEVQLHITTLNKDGISSATAITDVGYMGMVMILKRFIHAERARLWEEHLVEVEKILSYLVGLAAGHYKYVSRLPHYLESGKMPAGTKQTI